MRGTSKAATTVACGFALTLTLSVGAAVVWRWALSRTAEQFARDGRVDVAIAVCIDDLEAAAERAASTGAERADADRIAHYLEDIKRLAAKTGRAALLTAAESVAAYKIPLPRDGLVGETPKVEKQWFASIDAEVDRLRQAHRASWRARTADLAKQAARRRAIATMLTGATLAVGILVAIVLADRIGRLSTPRRPRGRPLAAADDAWHRIAEANGKAGENADDETEAADARADSELDGPNA